MDINTIGLKELSADLKAARTSISINEGDSKKPMRKDSGTDKAKIRSR